MTTRETIYEAPVAEVMFVETEGVFCSSPGNEIIGEEEGNGGFIY